MSGLCFALPPSLGTDNVRALAREFALVLHEAGFDSVKPTTSYDQLEQLLLSGEVQAAWGPPLICARVEEAGGAVALRAVRNGSVTYRSALVCRSHDDLTLNEIGQPGLRKLRAVWVDHNSMGGYILARHHLRTSGVNVSEAFESEQLLGSYEACFKAVLDCEADITATYANARGLGYVQLCNKDAHHLRTISYTAECSNDAVILGPSTVSMRADILTRLAEVIENPKNHAVFCAALNVDDLEPSPIGTYRDLLQLLE